ncbi:MAG: nucleoside hydrolase [Clostridia bacterium]|nr:nucleoside hydrolase [Clostridia bacterium]
MWFEKKGLDWVIPPVEAQVRALELPEGKIDMVLDTDTFNEVDDQFALAYALLSPERLNVEAIYAAPFYNSRSTGAKDGMEKSYQEIQRLLGKMNRTENVLRGSDAFLQESGYVDSPAARDLVERAMARADGERLYVVAIGAITNVASAILMEPKICEKIAVVWLGGHPTSYPTALEFNLSQDVRAARIVLDCGCPLTLVPCLGVASHLLTSVQELSACIGGKNPLCDALVELFAAYSDDHFAWAKEIWDVSTIAYLINPEWVPTKIVHSPLLTDDSHWAHDEKRHLIREAYFCRRNPIFRDLFEKLARA